MNIITVEQFKYTKQASKELIEKVKDWFSTNSDLEDYESLEYNGVSYNLYLVECGDWEDEGKYQYQYNMYQLASFDKNIKGWLCDESLIDKYNLFLGQCITRCGSYFSDYYYEYDKPDFSVAYIDHVPEVVIPAHDEVKLKELDGE